MDIIHTLRSIRRYTDQEVDEEQLERLLRSAMAAPSAGNQQPWHFVVIRDRTSKEAIAGYHPHARMVPSAPLAVVVCGDVSLEKHPGFWVQDCSAAIQNFLLEVTSMGLGAVWVGVYPNEERVTRTRELLGLPANVIPLAIIPVGHPAEESRVVDRYRSDRIHRERW